MQGVRLLGNEQIEIGEFQDPVPGPGEALIGLRYSALCGSELGAYRSSKPMAFNAGHEAMGVVVETNGTQALKPGDRVGVHAIWGCGQCNWCQEGKYTYCDKRRGTPGTHAQLLAAPEHALVKLADDIPDEVGVLLSGDGLGVPYHAAKRIGTQPGDVVVVLGVGPIGLGNTLMQSFLGTEVIAVDVNDRRLELARELGARHLINSRETDPIAAVKDITRGAMAHCCIECVGRSDALLQAFRLVGKAGTVMALGEQGDVPVNIGRDLIRQDITLMGSWFFHLSEYEQMAELYRRGLAVEKLVTHRFPLRDAAKAFAEFAAGRTGKVLLQMPE
ncbi:MAG: zinc-binding dehydrogenase [Firmicutes bacterium]|jgi:propanol-preferring alcohol dehydrogenase|nr:zinc-binding dehydrogenase [Bacillota bacterium]